MFSRRLFILVDVFLSITTLVGGSSVGFDSTRRRYYTTWFTIFKCRVCGSFLIWQFCFGFVRCMQLVKDKNDNIFEFNICVAVTFALALPIVAYLPEMFQPKNLTNIHNRLLQYASTFRGKCDTLKNFSKSQEHGVKMVTRKSH